MKVFVDTNTLLDVLAQRKPLYKAPAAVWSMAESGRLQAFVSAISFNNIYYVVRKVENKTKADKALCLMRDVFTSVPPDPQILNQAIDSEMNDFEDAIQYFSALHAQVNYLITRNPDDFPKQPIPIVSPEEFLAVMAEA